MKKLLGSFAFAAGLVMAVSPVSYAESLVKIPLAESGARDIGFNGSSLFTIDDGDAGSTGAQLTEIEFVGALDPVLADIFNSFGSFTLAGVTVAGTAQNNGGTIVQGTTGGTFQLYDPNNTLLLAGELTTGSLNVSTAGTGSFFNTVFGNFTGGALAQQFGIGNAGLSIALVGITDALGGGLSFATDGSGNITLNPFTADGSGIIRGDVGAVGGEEIPEPSR